MFRHNVLLSAPTCTQMQPILRRQFARFQRGARHLTAPEVFSWGKHTSKNTSFGTPTTNTERIIVDISVEQSFAPPLTVHFELPVGRRINGPNKLPKCRRWF